MTIRWPPAGWLAPTPMKVGQSLDVGRQRVHEHIPARAVTVPVKLVGFCETRRCRRSAPDPNPKEAP